MRILAFAAAVVLCGSSAVGQYTYYETTHLTGLHFYANQEAGGIQSAPVYTDVERLLGDTGGPEGSQNFAGDRGGWLIDVAVTDIEDSNAPFWQWAWQGGAFGATNKTLPGYVAFALRRATEGGKNHSGIVRLHPAYGRNVPHASDPYTLANYASDAKAVATVMKDTARYYVIGNEVNIRGEDHRYTSGGPGENTRSYATEWYATPEQYADVYMAVRDQLHTVSPLGSAGMPVALMQPVSPGMADAYKHMDGYDFLWRQIKQVNATDPSKIDGFAIHSYAPRGGPDYGNREFFNTIREQLCIIGQLGHGNKPVFLTEFNMDMWLNPGDTTVTVQTEASNFIKRAYQTMNAWNQGTGGLIPALGNINIVGTNWFVYPGSGVDQTQDTWNRMSLLFWKDKVPAPNDTNNSWYAFNYVANQHYARGAYGTPSGGYAWPAASIWWRDDFDGTSLDQTANLPHWNVGTGDSGSVTVSGGAAQFRGNGTQFGNAFIETEGYVFGDFALQTKLIFANAARSNSGSSPEANFDIRVRTRGLNQAAGYSMTFFSSDSLVSPGKIVLRRTGVWTPVGYEATVGIATGDTFDVRIIANGNTVVFRAYKNGNYATPAAEFNVAEASGPIVGRVAMGSYAISQVNVDGVVMGGPAWNFSGSAAAEEWLLY